MGHYDVLAKFLAKFPQFMEQVRFWSPGNTNRTVNIELADGQQFVFTYWNDKEWDLAAINTAIRLV